MRLAVDVLRLLGVRADGLFVVDAAPWMRTWMATGMTKTRRRKRRSGDVRSSESERGRRERFLSDRPCRRRQLESRALGHGIAGAPVEEALGFPW